MSLRVRSLLFVPGNRPELFAKVGRVHPDAVVVDLEDAVAPAEKSTARETALRALASQRPGAELVLVRVNAAGMEWYTEDVAAVAASGVVDGVVLPKYEATDQLTNLRSVLPAGAKVVVGIESGLGVADARPLLAAAPDAVYFGAEDYIADLGGRRTAAGTEVLYARSAVCLAARLAGVLPIDEAVVDVRDKEAFHRGATEGRNLGYRGKICVHPAQVAAARTVFTPTPEELADAEAIINAADQGVAVINGQMVDTVHVTMARETLRRGSEVWTQG